MKLLASLLAATLLATPAPSQVTNTTTTTTTTAPPDGVQIIVPPIGRHRPWAGQPMPIELSGVNATIHIDEQVSATTLELTLTNRGGTNQEAQILLPVPDGVSVRSLQYDGTGPEPKAEVLPREDARRIYDAIVAHVKDPALVEFAGFNLIRTSAFPIPAGHSQKLSLTYEQLLPLDGERVDYSLPRSESLAAAGAAWSIDADIKSKRNISTVYSPSHEITTERIAPNHMRVRLTGKQAAQPGSVRFSYLLEKARNSGVIATTLAYPDPSIGDGKGGFFMLLGGLPASLPSDAKPAKREVVMVLDRSGSMQGPKIKQVIAAATQIIDGLDDGEAFNIIDFSDSISTFAEKPVVKNTKNANDAKAYISHLQAGGGTNIHDAMLEAVRAQPSEGMLPMILFLTDGCPTVGERSELKIREAIKTANSAHRRIFAFGVGFDVNTPLLTNLSSSSRGASTFVLPDEDVEVKVSQVFRRLSGPILAEPKVTVLGEDGKPDTRATREMFPAEVPDLFDGDQIVLIGQYLSDKPIKLRIEGDYLGKKQHFDFDLDVSKASTKNSHIPRIWANRKVGALIDSIRQAGADPSVHPSDQAMKELVEEIVKLSTRYGILTEYTAFLAREDEAHFNGDGDVRMLYDHADANLRQRAMGVPPAPSAAPADRRPGGNGGRGDYASKPLPAARIGASSVNQDQNLGKQGAMNTPAPQSTPSYYDAGLNEVQITSVQNVADRTFFQRNNRWVDSALLSRENDKPDRTVEFGTPEYMQLVQDLAKDNRQVALALGGDVLIQVGKESVLVKAP